MMDAAHLSRRLDGSLVMKIGRFAAQRADLAARRVRGAKLGVA